MNKYATELKLPFKLHIDESTLNFSRIQNRFKPELIDKEFTDWLREEMGVAIHWCEVLCLTPGNSYPIHVDGEAYDRLDKGKLNYIVGGAGSEMVWYEDTEDMQAELNSTGKPMISGKEGIQEIYRKELSGFAIVNAGILHTVINKDKHRYCLTCSVTDAVSGKRLTYTELYEKFNGYIK